MVFGLPLYAAGVAFVASFIVSMVVKYGITQDTTKRGAVQLLTAGVVAFVMTDGIVPFVIVTLAPLWVGILLAVVVLIIMAIFGGVVIAPLVKGGYLGNHRKWLAELSNDDEFQAALHLLDNEKVVEIGKMSGDREHFRNQIIEEAGIPTDDT